MQSLAAKEMGCFAEAFRSAPEMAPRRPSALFHIELRAGLQGCTRERGELRAELQNYAIKASRESPTKRVEVA